MSDYTFPTSTLANGGTLLTNARAFALVTADWTEVTWLRANHLLTEADSEKRYFPSKELANWSFAHRKDVTGPENAQILGFRTLSFGVKKAKRTSPDGNPTTFPVIAREVAVYNWSPTKISDTLIGSISLHGVDSVLTTLFQDPVTGATLTSTDNWIKVMEAVGCMFKPIADDLPVTTPLDAILSGNFPIL